MSRHPVAWLALALLASPSSAGESDAPTPADAAPADAEPAWSVDAPPGKALTVPIDARSGTWMSVDVAPDGRHLVFDLLGDLYALPIDGGEARALTSGMAWDMQPRLSPDGRQLAFTSDRGGGDNLWVVEVDPKTMAVVGEPVAVTTESFRLVNSPTWTADGQALIGRKHFTKRRSLGSGELWLWDLRGGSGVQLTDKPNDQKDVGEPMAAPDGRTVYFSHDATPGAFFEYNKDPNAGIYAIDALDLMSGERTRITGGPGGAIRPTPSPDGRQLAFVRRVRGRSVLFVRELDSGRERPVWDGLDRDLQETWAIHGVYPQLAWTPDGAAIIAWAQGGLWRVPVADEAGEPTAIPFHVQGEREVRAARRHPVELAPAELDVRMPRHVAVRPDGKQVAFEALGYIWLKKLPNGKPRRMTKQTDHLEAFPAWSRDGQRLAWVTWDDAELGSVRVGRPGDEGRIVTPTPGHYVEPAWSPDGTELAWRRTTGGSLRDPAWSTEPGVYVRRLDAPDAPAIRVTTEGRAPHWGADPGRLFVRRRGERTELVSLGLRGTHPADRAERTHASSEMAVAFRVSPDGAWLAWQEHYDAHLTPLPAPGRPLSVSTGGTGLPMGTASRDLGDHLQFVGDSLVWTTGPELFQAPLDAVLDEAFDPVAVEPTPIGLSVKADRPRGTAALVGARLVTMGDAGVIADGTLVWKDDRIVAVGPREAVTVPAGAEVLDGTGLTVLPGFVDVHHHAGHGRDGLLPEVAWNSLSMLSFGVTTTHDPSNDTHTVFAASERQRAGSLLAPRLTSTGTILYGAAAAGVTAEVEGVDDAASHLRRLRSQGAFSVKSYNQPRRDQRQQILAAADELGMMVVPEGGSLLQHNLTQVVDGHTGIEHAVPVARLYDDVVQLWGGTEVGYTPTLGVAYGGLMGENYWYGQTPVWANERLQAFVPRPLLDAAARRATVVPDNEYNHIRAAQGAKALSDAGVRVNVGAHGQREGLAVHWEMWMLEQGGMSPLEALRAGTLNGAWYLGLDGDIGSLEAGKLADLAVVRGDPTTTLRDSEKVVYTVLGGRVYDAATLAQTWPDPTPAPALWFADDPSASPAEVDGARCGCGRH